MLSEALTAYNRARETEGANLRRDLLAKRHHLEELADRRVGAILTDGRNRARFLRNNSTLIPANSGFRYLAVIAADERVRGVEILGCKYPLKGATLSRKRQYAVSNEIMGNCAMISVKRGGAWIVESREKADHL